MAVATVQRSTLPPELKRRLESAIGADVAGIFPPLVDAAVAGANEDRALAAVYALSVAADASPLAQRRLTSELRLVLVRGVANRRAPDPTGQAGVLGVAHVIRAAAALVNMSEPSFAELQALLARAGSGPAATTRADADLERALILKAAAARSDRLGASRADQAARQRGQVRATQAERALTELEWFADVIRGAPREELVRMTTLLDVESMRNSTPVDPLQLLTADEQSDNDGLYQRYESSCAPATAQLALGEVDPVFAYALQDEGSGPEDGSMTAQQQREVLTSARTYDARNRNAPRPLSTQEQQRFRTSGSLPAGVRVESGNSTLRLAEQLRQRVDTWAMEAALNHGERRALSRFLRGARLSPGAERRARGALLRLRGRFEDAPTDTDVELMRAHPSTSERGMPLLMALTDVVESRSGVGYERRSVDLGEDGRRGGDLPQLFAEVAARLELGQSVPIRVGDPPGEGGHFMLLSDVRERGPRRRFLVSDPFTGRTAWVAERHLLDAKSGWIQTSFAMGWSQLTDLYVERAP